MEGPKQQGPRWAHQGLDKTGALPEEPGATAGVPAVGNLGTHVPCALNPSTAQGAPACQAYMADIGPPQACTPTKPGSQGTGMHKRSGRVHGFPDTPSSW